jgi:hypothetical protein
MLAMDVALARDRRTDTTTARTIEYPPRRADRRNERGAEVSAMQNGTIAIADAFAALAAEQHFTTRSAQ